MMFSFVFFPLTSLTISSFIISHRRSIIAIDVSLSKISFFEKSSFDSSEEKKEDLLAAVEDAAKVEPMNYAATGVTVFGHILSVNILYLHIYNVSNGDGEHLADETVDEGRLLMNFNLRTGKVNCFRQ